MSNSEEVTPVCTDINEETSGDEACERDEIHSRLKLQLSIDETVPFIQKKPRKLRALVPINALTQLYDIKRWVQFKLVSQTESIFTMSLEVNGQTFTGKGLSKKKARLNAAEQAVKSLLRLPSTEDADQPNGQKIPNADFITESGVCVLFNELQKGPDEDKLNVRDGKITKSGDADCDMQGCSKPQIFDAENVSSINVKQTTNESAVTENAHDQLSHLKLHVRFQFVSQTESIFTMSVEVNGQTFIGQGPSKKKAKLDAAEQVIRSFDKLPNAEVANQVMSQKIPNVGFTPTLAESEFNVLSNNLQESLDEEQIDVSWNSAINPNNSNRFSRGMIKESKQTHCTIPVRSLNELRTNLKNEILSEIMESPTSLCLSGSNYGVKSEIHEDSSKVPDVLVDLVSRLVDEKIASLTCRFETQNAVLAGIRARGYEAYSTSHICVAADDMVDSHK